MEDQIPLIQNSPPVNPVLSKTSIVVGIILFIVSITSSFLSGYYLNYLKFENIQPLESSTPVPLLNSTEPLTEENPEISTLNQVGREYYDDTIMAVSEDIPRKILVATATRQETDNGSNQASRVSYFDGDHWVRKIATKKYDSTAIYTNDLISKWKIDIDPSRVLKQSVEGGLKIEGNSISFDTGIITNNLGIRSLPGFTKFMSTGNGKLNVNGSSMAAKILYTRIYSNNLADMQFYETPFDLTTHWMAFWADDGNFYHIDSTDVAKSTSKYQTHQFGVMVNKDGAVSKTFEVKINADTENPPKSYEVQLGSPINKTINFTIDKSINKAPNNSYSWYMSNGVGMTENQISIYGVVEYIHH